MCSMPEAVQKGKCAESRGFKSLLQWHLIVHFSNIWLSELKGGRVVVERRGACSGRAVQLGTADDDLGTGLNALGSG
jgi:hypothetical protein